MTARTVLRVALLSLAFALAARALGWWSSAVLGLVWGALGTRRPVMEAGIAAVVGWLGLLALAAVTAGPRRDQLFQHETAAGSDS